MHDIDSTRLEASPAYELEDQQEGEAYSGEGEETFEMPMSESEEEALAAELLGVSNEQEMEQFLGGLIRKIKKRIPGAVRFLSQNAGPLAGALKGLAGKSLPFLGGALGTAIPIPGVGTAFGTALGNAASNLLQSETENMEPEEQEFEMAKRYVRLASEAVRQASRIPPRPSHSTAVNLAMRNAFRTLRGRGRYWSRPVYMPYQPCPPCPPLEPCPACPTCSQPLPGGEAASDMSASQPVRGQSTLNATQGQTPGIHSEAQDEGAFPYAGESESNEEYGEATETEDSAEGEGDYESEYQAASGAPRTGRWVRRGRKIVLYGL